MNVIPTGLLKILDVKIDYPVAFVTGCFILWIFSSKDEENLYLRRILEKFYMYVDGINFMILSRDTNGIGKKNKNTDPSQLNLSKTDTQVKRIIFIRHGESDWNLRFNKGFGIGMFFRLMNGAWREFMLYAYKDSVFLDSPLNNEGMEQALELRKKIFVDTVNNPSTDNLIFRILRGESDISSIIVGSNLRRALQTTCLALYPRLHKRKEKIIICSNLQEISRNIDTKALSGRKEIPDVSRIAANCSENNDKTKYNSEELFDPSENHGNKTLNFTGKKRMERFNEWAFARKESTIIVGGHSLWFKSYFRTYLPYTCTHVAKTRKMVNSGVVSFVLFRDTNSNGDPIYRIQEESIDPVYGGYENPKGILLNGNSKKLN